MTLTHKAYNALKGVKNVSTSSAASSSTPSSRPRPNLSPSDRQKIYQKFIRVNHAGEFGANEIYRGQLAYMKKDSDKELIQHMWDQEKVHLQKFEELMPVHKSRGTALLPLWRIAGYTLGASTAFMSKNAAMACTTAVEESIVAHYNAQLRVLLEDLEMMENKDEKHLELLECIKKFRDEEQEHHDTGIEHGAEETWNYKLLKGVIQTGCTAAIAVSERI